MPITEFWNITPYELNIIVKGYYDRLASENEIALNNGIYQAYLVSRWVWQKKIDIDKFLTQREKKEKKDMSDKEMLNQVKALNALFGGRVEKRK